MPAKTKSKGHPMRTKLALGTHIKIGNERVARDLALLQGARRESAMRDSAQPKSGNLTGRAWEAHILYGSSTDEQRSSSDKDRQPGGLFSGGVAPQSQGASARRF